MNIIAACYKAER